MKKVEVEIQQNSDEVQQEEVEQIEVSETVVEEAVEEKIEAEAGEEPESSEEPMSEEESEARLDALEEKSSIEYNDADRYRKLRDEYTAQSKEWKSKRDALNGQVRELITEAGKCRDERDQFNVLVRESKEQRDEWNAKVAELKEKLNELRPEKTEEKEKRGPSVQELRRNLSRMEFEQQTGSLSVEKEKALVKAISETAKKLKEAESEMEADAGLNSDYREVLSQFREAKSNAETAHGEMSKNAELAQTAHEKMISFYDQADKLRKEADGAQAKFVEFKKKSDEEHMNFVKSIKSAQETSSEAGAIKDRKASARKRKADMDTKKEAKEIFERFKSGDKLSTEDLMTLQRSGYL